MYIKYIILYTNERLKLCALSLSQTHTHTHTHTYTRTPVLYLVITVSHFYICPIKIRDTRFI